MLIQSSARESQYKQIKQSITIKENIKKNFLQLNKERMKTIKEEK